MHAVALCLVVFPFLLGAATAKSSPSAEPRSWFMTQRSQADVDSFRSWFTEHGGFIHPSVQLRQNFKGDVSAVVAEPVDGSEVLLSVPHSLFLCTADEGGSQDTIFSTPPPIITLFDKVPRPVFQPPAILAARVMNETRRGESSMWYPFLNAMPGRIVSSHLFGPSARGILDATTFAAQKDSVARSAMDHFLSSRPKWDALSGTGRAATWAFTVVRSRSQVIPSNAAVNATFPALHGQRCLIPGVDLLNHGVGEQVSDLVWTVDDATQEGHAIGPPSLFLTVVSPEEGYRPGDVVDISYGRLPNNDLLPTYGFSIRQNPYESVEVELKLPERAPAPVAGLAKAMGLTQGVFRLYAASRLPEDLCNSLRLRAMPEESGQDLLDRLLEGDPTVLRSEVNAHGSKAIGLDVDDTVDKVSVRALQSLLLNLLDRYDTTVEQDLLRLVQLGGPTVRVGEKPLDGASITALVASISEKLVLQDLLISSIPQSSLNPFCYGIADLEEAQDDDADMQTAARVEMKVQTDGSTA